MRTLPVRAPTSCQVPILSGAQEYELSLSVSLCPPSSSQLHLLSVIAPPTALRSFFIYECILLNCVCKRTNQPLPCQHRGTRMLEPGFDFLRLRGHPTLVEVTHTFLLEVVDQFFHQQRTHTLVMELKWLRSIDTTTTH